MRAFARESIKRRSGLAKHNGERKASNLSLKKSTHTQQLKHNLCRYCSKQKEEQSGVGAPDIAVPPFGWGDEDSLGRRCSLGRKKTRVPADVGVPHGGTLKRGPP